MTTHFQIGLPISAWTANLREEISKALAMHDWTCTCHELPEDQSDQALLVGNIDILVRPLHQAPVILPDGMANAAIISRSEPASTLLIRPGARAQRPFQLKEGARIASPHSWLKTQLRDFRPDLEWAPDQESFQADSLDAMALTLPEAEAVQTQFPGLTAITLNPRECCPPPGMGAILIQCCEADRALRRQLLVLHRQDIAELTNVERRMIQLVPDATPASLGAFCERDLMNNLHLWVAFGSPPIRTRQSSSTTAGLAEQALATVRS